MPIAIPENTDLPSKTFMKKWKEVKKNFQWYLVLPKTPIQAEQVQCVFRGMAAFILSLLLYIWQKKKAKMEFLQVFSRSKKIMAESLDSVI